VLFRSNGGNHVLHANRDGNGCKDEVEERYKKELPDLGSELAEYGVHDSPALSVFWRSANKEHETKLRSWDRGEKILRRGLLILMDCYILNLIEDERKSRNGLL